MTNNSLDGSLNRFGAPQRTGSLKSSKKDRPPPYRPTSVRSSADSMRQQVESNGLEEQRDCLSQDSTPSQTDGIVETGEIINQQSLPELEADLHPSKPTTCTSRGIPNEEIVGSSVKKLPRSLSKCDSNKKTSKLPRISSSTVQEPSVSDTNSIPDHPIQQRRNSLERPSYYNSLYNTGTRSYNPSTMTRSLNLPGDQMLNGDSANQDLFKYQPSARFDGESSASSFDSSIRPYNTLGRTYSMKNPTRSYDTLKAIKTNLENELDSKYASKYNPVNIARVSSMKDGERFSSRFLRPKSFYGGTDLTGIEPNIMPDNVKSSVDFGSERKSAFVGRRSPSYQRTVSLFEGSKIDEYRQSLSATPDRSVLGKYFGSKKSDKESENLLRAEIKDKSKNRKMSRFLRPDFYDTPKEDSVYQKEENGKNASNGDIWKEKSKKQSVVKKKSSKKMQDNATNQDSRLSIVDKAIKSLKENSVSKSDRESMDRESNLIKRAVSLEDCSLAPENRSKRATSLTPQTNYESKLSSGKLENMFQKKKVEDFRKIVDKKLNRSKDSMVENNISHKDEDSVIKKLVRKISPKNRQKLLNNNNEEITSSYNGIFNTGENNVLDDSFVLDSDNRSRLSKIAGLKRLEFSRPLQSADSTPSIEDSKMSGELDDSSSFLSPTEDNSDTWSISSDYTDARDVITAPAEDSVSERIRRKSFYSRFNQSKRRKSQSSQMSGSRSRLPMYSKSMSSDLTNGSLSKPTKKVSDIEAPVEK